MNRSGSDKSYHYLVFVVVIILLFPTNCLSQINKDLNLASKPLFHDPLFDGAADPTVICNRDKPVFIRLKTPHRK